jgi:hypothetical protein
MGYGRVLDEIPQNIPNKQVICKIFSVKGLGEDLAVFAPQLRHFPAKYSCERGYGIFSALNGIAHGICLDMIVPNRGEMIGKRERS